MSYALSARVWSVEDLSSAEMFVLMALCDYADDKTHTCFPLMGSLAEKCRMGERSVRRHVSTLLDKGYISRVERMGRSGIILINADKLAESTPAKTDDQPANLAPSPVILADERKNEGANLAAPPANLAYPPANLAGETGQIGHPNQSLNLSLNQSLNQSPGGRATDPPNDFFDGDQDAAKPEKKDAKRQRTSGTRISPDWELDERDFDEAKKCGFGRDEARRMADEFRDYWLACSGANALKCDWAATWRNWCRRQERRGQDRGGNTFRDRGHRASGNGFADLVLSRAAGGGSV